MKFTWNILIFLIVVVTLSACKHDNDGAQTNVYNPTPYQLTVPTGFPQPKIPQDNPLTVEGVTLGRHLFYDKILSGDNSQSCASCHNQDFSFSDNGHRFSKGIDNLTGNRNAHALINLAFRDEFFWDGRSVGLENQVQQPVINPIEMHLSWSEAVSRLQAKESYTTLFQEAFGTKTITKELAAKALAQFLRTMISSNSKYDKFVRHEVALTPSEANGLFIFNSEKGDCFHCHSLDADRLATDNKYHNNGLDETFTDLGRALVTMNANDNGKFLTPTLRNIELTGPYMHDGRFNTLEEVIEHYNSGGKPSPTIDVLMKHQGIGLQLLPSEKQDLVNFLKTLTDQDFIANPDFTKPF